MGILVCVLRQSGLCRHEAVVGILAHREGASDVQNRSIQYILHMYIMYCFYIITYISTSNPAVGCYFRPIVACACSDRISRGASCGQLSTVVYRFLHHQTHQSLTQKSIT